MIFILGVLLNESGLMILATMMGVVIAIAHWWRLRSLDQVIYRRRPFYRRAFPGEQVELEIEVENRKLLPISWLRVSDLWPEAVAPEEEDALGPSHIPRVGMLTNIFSLRWYERTRRKYTLLFRRRGVFRIGPARLDSGDLFGFFEHSREVGPDERLTVFPEMIPLKYSPFPTEDPFGEIRTRQPLYEDPTLPMGVRDYLPEDDFRRVHWPATARLGELQSKVYQPVAARVLVVCLNIATFSRHWEGTNPDLMEHAVGVTASLVTKGIEDGYRVGLISNGCLANSDQPFRVRPARSTKQLALLLESLAGVTPIITSPFERFLIKEVPRLPYRATLLIVTSITPPGLLETLIRLRQHGRTITLISFAPQPPPEIPGLRCIHAPFEEPGS